MYLRSSKNILKTLVVAIFTIGLLGFPLKSIAEEKTQYHVMPLDSNFDASKMASKKTVIHSVAKTNETDIVNKLPSNQDVILILKHAGFSSELEKMDALDRDQLYLRAKKYSLMELEKNYPNIPKEKLEALHNSIRKY